MRRLFPFVCLVNFTVLSSETVQAGDWPRFLGPTHDAKVSAEDVAGLWPETGLHKEWEFKKGKGWACPAVVGGRVYLFHRLGAEEVLDCLEAASGKPLWQAKYEAPYRDRYGASDGPRTSAVVNGDSVFTFGVTGQLHCFDSRDGRIRWKRDLGTDYAMALNFFGHGSTPLVADGRVILPIGGSDDRAVVALEEATGKELWVTRHAWGAGYASPIPARVLMGGEERDLVIIFTGGESRPPTGGVLCLDAKTGKLLGEQTHRAEVAESVNAASPLVFGNQVFTTEGYGSGGLLTEIQNDGSLKDLWRTSKLGSQFGTPIARDGMILGFDGQNPRLAELVCLDAKTGGEKWREDFGGKFGRGNLVDLGGRGILVLGEFGELARIQISPTGAKIEQRVSLFEAPESWTIPVLSGKRLYVTQNERGRDGSSPRLICYSF